MSYVFSGQDWLDRQEPPEDVYTPSDALRDAKEAYSQWNDIYENLGETLYDVNAEDWELIEQAFKRVIRRMEDQAEFYEWRNYRDQMYEF